MADLSAFRAKSASFSTAITGVTDASVSESGNASDLETDADSVIKGVVVDGIGVNATVTTTDVNRASAIGVGSVGSLVIVFEKRADGKGAAASGSKTATIADAVCVDNGVSGQSAGIGSAAIQFRGKAVAWT